MEDMTKLSILIPVVPSHEAQFNTLLSHLRSQANEDVQILYKLTKSFLHGGPHTGAKRQQLLSEAIGDYIVFIDADDWVPDYYVSEMLKACMSGADCFAINGIMTTNGDHETKWFISKNFQNKDVREGNKMVYYRRTNHITGVKRSIALAAGFPDKSNAEDKYYSDRLVLRSEYKIEPPMYTYRFSTLNKQYK